MSAYKYFIFVIELKSICWTKRYGDWNLDFSVVCRIKMYTRPRTVEVSTPLHIVRSQTVH